MDSVISLVATATDHCGDNANPDLCRLDTVSKVSMQTHPRGQQEGSLRYVCLPFSATFI